MACTLTSGRTEPCRDAVGGIKNIYLLDYLEDAFTVSAGQATAINVGVTNVFKYELLNDTNTLVETVTSDQNNGTTIVEQVFTAQLNKQTQESIVEFNILIKARPIVVVQDRMGNFKIVGLNDGTVVSGDAQSGGAKGEFNGYNFTFTATETEFAPYLDSATQTALLALVSATNVTP